VKDKAFGSKISCDESFCSVGVFSLAEEDQEEAIRYP
jgi:hypothetical protein